VILREHAKSLAEAFYLTV